MVDDGEGICERLDRDIQTAVDAYVDPWLEADEPVHPTQFVNIINLTTAGGPENECHGML
ncbi:MAG TPA: hypothetical protein VKM94_26670 [Blastocatellia bacterium]|nr:hypothetical protein [Blastocatellia bacterium]